MRANEIQNGSCSCSTHGLWHVNEMFFYVLQNLVQRTNSEGTNFKYDKMNVQTNLYFKDDFTLGPGFKTNLTVSLTSNSITYESNSTKTSQKIKLEDIIGATARQLLHTGNDIESAYIHIYSYPLKKRVLSTTAKRQRLEYVFAVSGKDSSVANLEIAEKWVRCIKWLLVKNSDINLATTREDNPPRQQFLIFINPFSGKGSSMNLFKKKVKPMLEEADVQYELIVTEHMGHAKEIVQNMKDFKKFDCIVCCSGDGIINEIINGLMNRPDWQEAIKTPFGHIPCGSGNGLCASSLYHSGEPFDMISSIFTVLRGEEWPLDIVKVQSPEVHYSFLCIVFGIVSDVDIESEKYRKVGDIRFSVMALKKIMEKRTFSGKLSYLPVENGDCVNGASSVCNSRGDETVQLSDGASKCKEHGSEEQRNLEDGKLEGNNLKDGNLSNGTLNDGTLDKSKSEQPSSDEISNLKGEKLDNGGKLDRGKASNGILGSVNLASGIPNKFMPNFYEPIPESWNVIEDDFVGWVFVSTTHIGRSMFCAPEGSLGDGIIHCMCLNGDMSRSDLLNTLGKMERGEHASVNGVYMLKARAFRIEPFSATSEIITIDGEVFNWSKLQAEVYGGLGRVRCCRPAVSTNRNSDEQ